MKNPPVAVCTKCQKYSHSIELVNQQCNNTINKKRCQGVFRSAIAPGDWDKCPSCNGSGREEGTMCLSCQGSGHIFVRKTS